MKKSEARILKTVIPIIIRQLVHEAQNPRDVKQVFLGVQDCGGIQTHGAKYPCFLVGVQIEYVKEGWRGD